MAIIGAGELLVEGAPAEALAALNGKIWSKIVSTDDELRAKEKAMRVVSTHLLGGKHEVRVFAEANPGGGFQPVDSDLEDVYFLNLSRQSTSQPAGKPA